MTETPSKPASLLEALDEIKGVLGAFGPAEWDSLRAAGRKAFTGIPNTHHEEWKYTSLRSLEETKFAAAYGANVVGARSNLQPLPA